MTLNAAPPLAAVPHRSSLGVLGAALFGLALLSPASASAADLDVGSGQTYATIQDAVDAAAAGDVIRVHGGTYAEDLDLSSSGSQGNAITIDGNIDGTVTLQGAVRIDGSWWVVSDLVVEAPADVDTFRVNGDHNLLLRLDLSGGDRDGVDGAGVGNEVRECHIHDYYHASNDAHCIVLNPGAEDWVIADSELHDCCGDGVQLYASDAERSIVNTRIENNTFYYSGAVDRAENAIDVKNADGLVIVGNVMWGFGDNKTVVFQKGPIGIDMQCNVMYDGFTGVEFRSEDGGTVENIIFARNLMHDFTSYALKFDGTDGAQVFNNTFVDADSDGLRIEGAGLDNGEVRNNLWVRTGSVEGGNFTADHNGFWETGSVDIGSGSDVDADPLLDGDYHLGAGSPMIDTGVDVGFEYGGAAPDIGFHEVGIDGCEPPPATGGSGGTGAGSSTGGDGGTGAGSSTGGSSSGGTSAAGSPPGATPDDSGDCGCRTAPSGSSAGATLGLLLWGALGLRRRRRGKLRTAFPRACSPGRSGSNATLGSVGQELRSGEWQDAWTD